MVITAGRLENTVSASAPGILRLAGSPSFIRQRDGPASRCETRPNARSDSPGQKKPRRSGAGAEGGAGPGEEQCMSTGGCYGQDYARRTVTAPLLRGYENLTGSTAQNSRSEPKRTGRSAALLPSRNVVNWGFQPIALQGEKPPSKRRYEV